MSYVQPPAVVDAMVEAGVTKADLSVQHLLIRGALGAFILAAATTLAVTAAVQTGLPLVGAVVFPVGFVMVILLGLELVTGSFALIPLAVLERHTTVRRMLRNFGWVILGHLFGGGLYALMFAAVVTSMGTDPSSPVADALVALATAKTTGYGALGASGVVLVLVKAVLCNWLVTLGVVMAMTSTTTGAKIAAMWLPVTAFFALAFEHAVVNMFVIPVGMLLGADVTVIGWWLWNQAPVLLGNFVGAVFFTGFGLYFAHRSGVTRSVDAQPAQPALDPPAPVDALAAQT